MNLKDSIADLRIGDTVAWKTWAAESYGIVVSIGAYGQQCSGVMVKKENGLERFILAEDICRVTRQ